MKFKEENVFSKGLPCLTFTVYLWCLQVALLKGGCIEMMVLRSTMTYDGQRNQWKVTRAYTNIIKVTVCLLRFRA